MAISNVPAFSVNSPLLHTNRSGICYDVRSVSPNALFASGKDFSVRQVNNLPGLGVDTFIFNIWSSPIQHHSVLGCTHKKGTGFHQSRASTGQKFHKLLRPCQVKSEDSEGTLSGETTILDAQTLKQELQIAIKEENYAQAAKIRDSLRVLHKDGIASVLAANARFYTSFRNGDLVAMQALWAKSENVCCVHPGVSGILGYDLVMGSWEFVWADYDFPLQIELKDIQVHVRGDIGYVTCVEFVKTKGGSWGKQFATNVFERIDGQWFINVHHASYVDL